MFDKSSKITVAMITKNSLENCGKALSLVILAVLNEIPFSKFVLVDSSVDETASYFREFLDEIEVIRSTEGRAVARQIAIDRTTTEWLLFVDDDCVLEEDWFNEAKKFMDDPTTGLIWGIDRPSWLHDFTTSDAIRTFHKRGGTHDTLLRMSALKEIRIPPFLHEYEDAYIKRHVLVKGYSSRISSIGVRHIEKKRYEADRQPPTPFQMFMWQRTAGVYRPDLKRSLRLIAGMIASVPNLRKEDMIISLGKKRDWFMYYSGLFLLGHRNPFGVSVVQRDSIKWIIPNYSDENLMLARFDERLIRLLDFHRCGIFVDIGANIGQYSLRAAKSGAIVHAFEGDFDNFRLLQRNVHLNYLEQYVNARHELLSDVQDKANCQESYRIHEYPSEISPPISTIDDQKFSKSIDLIRIDAKGRELKILNGALETIRRDCPNILITIYAGSSSQEKDLAELLFPLEYNSQIFYAATSKQYFFGSRSK